MGKNADDETQAFRGWGELPRKEPGETTGPEKSGGWKVGKTSKPGGEEITKPANKIDKDKEWGGVWRKGFELET